MEQLAINYANAHNVFVAVASGNTGEYLPNVGPASAKRAFTVGAVDTDMFRSTISSFGPNNALMAPGENIFSIRSSTSFHKRAFKKDSLSKYYFTQDGTSFAAPMVAATASLMLTLNPDLSPSQTENILLATAVDMDDPQWDFMTGAGLLNATQALKNVNNEFLTLKITNVLINKNKKKKKLESVDVFATVSGKSLDNFIVEIGKGKRAKKFKQVAGPFNVQADHDWVARIDKKNFKGSSDWMIRLKAIDQSGNTKTAKTLIEFN